VPVLQHVSLPNTTNMKKILLLFAVTASLSCNNRAQTIIDREPADSPGTLTEKYQAAEVGWTTELPKNWGEMTNADADKMTSNGLTDIKESTGVTVNAESLRQLVNLKKNQYNYFLSSVEPYDSNGYSNYAEHFNQICDLIESAFKSKSVQYEMVRSTTMIDGLEFYKMETTIFSADKKDIVMNQQLLTRVINHLDFGMTLMYNNKEDKNDLEEIIKKSKFSIH
jgi:hypothetical protein